MRKLSLCENRKKKHCWTSFIKAKGLKLEVLELSELAAWRTTNTAAAKCTSAADFVQLVLQGREEMFSVVCSYILCKADNSWCHWALIVVHGFSFLQCQFFLSHCVWCNAWERRAGALMKENRSPEWRWKRLWFHFLLRQSFQGSN